MATEILRPTKVELGLGNETFYPETTDAESLNILINEEVADDASTWIKITSTALDLLRVQFDSLNLREHYTKILECNIFSRVQLSDTAATIKLSVEKATIDDSGAVTGMGSVISTKQPKSLASTDWQTITCSFSGSDIISAIEKYLQNINTSGIEKASPFGVQFQCSASSNSAKNTTTLTVSQVYAEIVYSDDSGDTTTETFYLKENGNWVGYSNISLYRKDNGTWTITDATVFGSGGNYIIQREDN